MLSKSNKGQHQRLRDNLIEHFDYEALYPVVWKHLYSWYSADIQVVRNLKKDVLNRHVMILDLYPEQARGARRQPSGVNSEQSESEPQLTTKQRMNNHQKVTEAY